MANINLLPWREEAREKQTRDYIGLLVLVFLLAGIIVYFSLMVVESISDTQKSRNAYLQSEIQLLEAQIVEITQIKNRKEDIERRTEIILDLQQSRNLPTHILDELVRVVPTGIYLSRIERKGSMLWIEGRSESNNNVANMMRNIKASTWLQDPNMQSIITQNEASRQLQHFTLRVEVVDQSNHTSHKHGVSQ